MPMFVLTSPLPPGKTEQWRSVATQFAGPLREEFSATRRAAGVREALFLHSTPQGDIVIAVFDGDDPQDGIQRLLAADDDFSLWVAQQIEEIYGDMLAKAVQAPPELVVDSHAQ